MQYVHLLQLGRNLPYANDVQRTLITIRSNAQISFSSLISYDANKELGANQDTHI